MAFRKHWINLLHSAAKGTKKTRALLTPIGLTIFGAFTALFVFAAIFVDRLLSWPRLLPECAILPISIPLISMGLVITAWSAVHFLKVQGTPVPFNPPPKVVNTGPYRHASNPMLTGVFLFLFGIGFGINSVSLVFFFTPLYVLINVWELKKSRSLNLLSVWEMGISIIEGVLLLIPGFRSKKCCDISSFPF